MSNPRDLYFQQYGWLGAEAEKEVAPAAAAHIVLIEVGLCDDCKEGLHAAVFRKQPAWFPCDPPATARTRRSGYLLLFDNLLGQAWRRLRRRNVERWEPRP
jgi:hypothetical protein